MPQWARVGRKSSVQRPILNNNKLLRGRRETRLLVAEQAKAARGDTVKLRENPESSKTPSSRGNVAVAGVMTYGTVTALRDWAIRSQALRAVGLGVRAHPTPMRAVQRLNVGGLQGTSGPILPHPFSIRYSLMAGESRYQGSFIFTAHPRRLGAYALGGNSSSASSAASSSVGMHFGSWRQIQNAFAQPKGQRTAGKQPFRALFAAGLSTVRCAMLKHLGSPHRCDKCSVTGVGILCPVTYQAR